MGRNLVQARIIAFDPTSKMWMEIPLSWLTVLFFIWISSLLDYFLTLLQIFHGIMELNPILAPFFHSDQYILAFFVKMGLTFVGILLLSILYKSPLAKKAGYFLSIVYSCLLVYHILNLSLIANY